MRRLLVVLALVALVAPAPAVAEPCWQRLISDWYDGRVDGVYPPACYRAAIERLPADVQADSLAPAELRNAFDRSLAAPSPGRSSGEQSPIPALIVIAAGGVFLLFSFARMLAAGRAP